MVYLYSVNLLACLAGVVISSYIFIQKKRSKPIVCNINHNCDAVVNSEYGNTIGIDNAILGGIYYTLSAIGYGVTIFSPVPAYDTPLTSALFFATIAGLTFSLYLLYIMQRVIRHKCTWCYGSLGCNIVMTLSSLAIVLLR